ncbi:rhodanese-like domain-containing protein [Leptospira kemamanensis]|uniref:Rhodanese-like domain-containing protein n=1 Tax=Leptospira kemamanensis TaxID=2484942 RepID=A0A4V3JPR2_9LEPT|nr:rhodanese-like domain-containing protein [Leptospira kemamanensis]TGL46776.1 rhodanese-like domain-containing protein [Leptospira kemamanensis]
MKRVLVLILCLFVSSLVAKPVSKQTKKPKVEPIPNRLIDYSQFKKIVNRSESERETHRLTEDQFLKMMTEEGVVVLDARSENRYKLLHIKGAVNLPFTEFTKDSLATVIPEPKAKILIYCNNNFEGNEQAFAAKSPAASLNLSTYNSLKAYGYNNIYELGPLLDVNQTKLPLVSEPKEGNEVKETDNTSK